MAYLSREFWKSDDDRQRAASAAAPVGSELAPGAASSNPVASSGTAQVDPGGSAGAIRSFFDANQDQGAKVLGGLSDSINQRIASTAGRLETPPEVSSNSGQINPLLVPLMQEDAKKRNDFDAQQAAAAEKGKEVAARNTAAIQPLAPDVQTLGAGQEGIQSLLGTQNAASGYTPGQARLDAWLAGAASNANPGVVGGTLGAYEGLKATAAETQRPGPPPPAPVGMNAPASTAAPGLPGLMEWLKKQIHTGSSSSPQSRPALPG